MAFRFLFLSVFAFNAVPPCAAIEVFICWFSPLNGDGTVEGIDSQVCDLAVGGFHIQADS